MYPKNNKSYRKNKTNSSHAHFQIVVKFSATMEFLFAKCFYQTNSNVSLSLYEISKGNYFHLFHHHSKRKKVFKCPETVSFFWKKKKRFAVDQKKGRRGNSKPVTAVMSLTWKDANLIGVAAYHTLHSGMPAIPTMPGMSLLSSHHSQLSPKNSLIFFKHNSVFVRWHLVCLATQRSTLPEHEGGSF